MRQAATKIIVLLLTMALFLNMGGCASVPDSAAPTQAAAESPSDAAPPAEAPSEVPVETSADTVPETPKGSLFLTVSSITFSVVGEDEDIYLGVIPRELVTWESEDPDIVSVDSGVLTAMGVGTTVIHASYQDQQVSCSAGCLAEDSEALKAVSSETRSLPKRLPPEVDLDVPCTYFNNSAIVGDSITFVMMQFESTDDTLGDMLFLAMGGVSVNGFVRRFKNLAYQGYGADLEDIIAKSGVERVYFFLGSNDVGSDSQREIVIENWNILLDRIQEKSPDVDIVMLTNIPKYEEFWECGKPGSYNCLMAEYNENLRQLAKERECKFIDMGRYFEDHWNRLPAIYNQDGYHMNKLGCMTWMQALRFYAQYESEGGLLK